MISPKHFMKAIPLRLSSLVVLLSAITFPLKGAAESFREVPHRMQGQLVCFVQTNDSRTVDLTPLCSPKCKISQSSAGDSQLASAPDSPKVRRVILS